ncbi:cyclin-dependent kinase inhibitor 3 [Tripterygium wilfordii]|uniref:cyclin-dependent kinase inhibitor 3 n=1 Tax=Tripterygium wilfordii TaxID=458696 RepID=UPI0018F7F178|nr:cyclin-dependent kinase inhibitor 3 [Tripterygium wilfordii]XP_038692726.1 cyclin-dependent kinase inhibitor 3 [Tripterygium wilfordii]XP_038692727.1 cyclin-dependent kinase inhibitor 3 [Tripterygium wilfordii]
MGKYMNKSKIKGDVAVMDVGVRTRAKTLALQRLQSQSPFQQHHDSSSLYYLQLRSRRLEKPVPPACRGDNHGSRREIEKEYKEEDVEASCGENCLDSGSRDRTTRESTPCSLIRDPSKIVTPGSTSRRKSSVIANRGTNNDIQNNNPIMLEVEEFFACAEQQQQREFMEKYNFDIVNDLPLPGRYEWVKIF